VAAADAAAMAAAHRDSIQALGPRFYPPPVVEGWSAAVTPEMYAAAMQAGEVFFVATGTIDGEAAVLGFSSHRPDDDEDGASVYVRGGVARQGIGSALLRLAEAHARAHDAASIAIQASLAAVAFYRANGFEEIGRGAARLMTGASMACVFMRKRLSLRG
jgi:putative acetyltransferase